jgi:hypothetical protein
LREFQVGFIVRVLQLKEFFVTFLDNMTTTPGLAAQMRMEYNDPHSLSSPTANSPIDPLGPWGYLTELFSLASHSPLAALALTESVLSRPVVLRGERPRLSIQLLTGLPLTQHSGVSTVLVDPA